ncbi:Ca2+-binding protein, RTX toxin-related [Tardiphaga sp. OK246]|uniref:calcium-binding protein n=1 Tax=Tardiphaga sp. OK246 TaxID=1855307 RepID=UPI000B65F8E2|nr:calcium-binding protein [Tardiphaga sp. OK246]SNT01411.1 Ca2+-binding protein, RTX toxin-related [Tardiphaga sp. OK246]
MAGSLTGMALYAALSEHIYRRDASLDQSIKLVDITGANAPLAIQNLPAGLNLSSDNGYIYSTGGGTSGFVAMVNVIGDKYVVTFRGTDSNVSAWESVYAGFMNGNTPTAPTTPNTYQGVLDYGDLYTSRNLGFGSTSTTQWDAAKALVDLVLNTLANGDKSKVVVTGQSMGGGLAGLASAYFGVEGDVFAPAPYAAQLKIEAVRLALPEFLQQNSSYFSGLFFSLSADAKVQALATSSFTGFRDYLFADTQASFEAMKAALAAATQTYTDSFQLNINSKLHVQRVDGEMLTAPTFLGTLTGAVSEQLKAAEKIYQIGDASDEGKHSPALHALLALTDQGSQKFEDLLRKDQILRYSIVGEPNAGGSKLNLVSAPIDHGRVGPTDDPSKLLSSGPNSNLMEDLLWKAYGTGANNLYDYFYKLFNDTLTKGAASTGMDRDNRSALSIHDGVVKLALQVLRDAAQNTSTLNQVKANLGGTWNFAGGSADGVPYQDKVIINLSQITATDPLLKDSNGQAFGVRDINYAIATAAKEAIATVVRDSASQSILVKQLIGRSPAEIEAGVAFGNWDKLVVQAGLNPLSYDARATGVTADATKSHVVFGGNGEDTIKGSTVKDYLIGGDGKDTFESGGGNDLIIGGNGEDRFIARIGSTVADGVIFLGGPDKDTAVYGDDFNGISLSITASRAAQYSGQVGANVGYGARIDQLIGVERLELGKGNDTAAFTNAAQKLGMTIALSGGSNTFLRTQDQQSPNPAQVEAKKGAFTTIEFSTVGATGAQTQTLTTSADFQASERSNAVIVINGHQLVGGATFDFDKFEYISNGNVKPIHLMNSSQSFPVVATDAQLQRWIDQQTDVTVKYFAGISGGLAGFSFAAILYADLAKFVDSWNSAYIQRIVGVYGEVYNLGSLAADGTRTLTITLNAALDGVNQTVVINNWKQGDYGISISQFSYGQGLDSGTNKNGQVDSPGTVSLATLRARLAEIGIVPSAPTAPGPAARSADDGSDDAVSLVRVGNAEANDIAGGLGDDLLRGYAGDDNLLGDAGHDIYVFAVGDGHDTIEDLSPEGGVIRFVEGLDVSLITKQLVAGSGGNQDLLITYGQGDTILIKDWSTLSPEQQALWTFESVTGKFTPANSADEPDLSVVPEEAGGVALTLIEGTGGADVLDGIDIDEQISGQGGDDVINAYGGADTIDAGDGNDIVDGGAGSDTIRGGRGDDRIAGGDGDDIIINDFGDDVFIGGRGNDKFYIENKDNGNDTFIFNRGDGQDIIASAFNSDTLRLGPGILPSDILILRPLLLSAPTNPNGDLAGDMVIRIAGTDDQITFRNSYVLNGLGDPNADMNSIGPLRIVFDNGVIWSREDLLRIYAAQAATSSADEILGSPNDETFQGGLGDDVVYGNGGNDTFVWNRGDGNDTVVSLGGGKDLTRLAFGSGITTSDVSFSMSQGLVVAGENGGIIAGGFDRIVFADGTVWTRADINQRLLNTQITGGNDTIVGTVEADVINGGNGNDTIEGKGGRDILDGGAGNDTLTGNGTVIYRFGSAFGQDVVHDTSYESTYPLQDADSHRDRIEFTAYNLADFMIARTGSYDLLMSRIGSTDQVTITGYGIPPGGSIENVLFQDGTMLAYNQINAIADRMATATNVINGTASADSITGTATGDRIMAGTGVDTIHAGDGDDLVYAGDGDDIVTGDAGNDILLGGAGIDNISGGAGSDIIYGGTGNDVVSGDAGADVLFGEGGNDQLVGGANNDTLYGNLGDDALTGGADNDTLYGNLGDDELTGGAGGDMLVGGAGNDTYVFNRGDGQDIIRAAVDRTPGETETLVLGGGITLSDVHYALDGRDLIISFTASPADRVTVKDFLGAGVLSSIVIGGVVQSTTQILDSLTGATSAGGNALPTASSGGTSLVYGGRGNDTLTGNDQGNTYVFVNGDGQDRLDSPRPFFRSGTDDLMINGYASSDVVLSRAGTDGLDLRVTFTSGSDRIDISGQFGNGFIGIDSIGFDDGTVWLMSDIKSRIMSQAATGGNDVITGFDDSDDIVRGGAGDDALAGAGGSDRYVLNIGDGRDTITDSSGSDDRLEFGAGIWSNSIAVTRSATDANDVILTVSGTDAVTLKGFLAGSESGVDKVVFADGTVWSKTTVANAILASKMTTGADTIVGTGFADAIAGGLGNDTLSGGAGGDTYSFNRGDGQDNIVELQADGNDRLKLGSGITVAQVTLRKGSVDPTDLVVDIGGGETITVKGQLAGGGAGIEAIMFADGTVWGPVDIDQKLMTLAQTSGADTIYGSGNADTITGGAGNDVLDGRGGADVYVFNRGHGQDTIFDSGTGLDRIEFGAGIVAADVDFSHGSNPNDLIITLRGSTDSITVKDHFVVGGARIGQVVLADGTVWFTSDIAVLAGNHAPTVVSAIGTKNVAQNALFSFAVPANTFVDSDAGDTLVLTATRADGSALPAWLRFDGATFSGTPANADVGLPIQVRLSATDRDGDIVTHDFTVNVTNINDAPVSTTLIANKQATIGSAFSFQFTTTQFVDPDNGLAGVTAQTLTYTAKLGSGAALPSWLTFDAATRTFSGTPVAANSGALDIVITASDGVATGTARFGIFVGTSGNTAPAVGTAIGTQTAAEDSPFTFQLPAGTFSDSTAGDRLRYTATLSSGAALPSWIVLDAVTGAFSGTPGNANVGQSTIRVTATDIFGASASANFTLNVTNVNDAPTAVGTLDNFVTNEDALFSYTIPPALFSDVDAGDVLLLSARLADGSPLPDWLIFNPATRTLSGIPDGEDVGILKVIVVATDTSGASVERSMFVLVNSVNDAPVVTHALEDIAVDRGQAFTFTVPANTFADDGGGVSLVAKMADGTALPDWLSFDPLTRTFVGNPDYSSVGDYEGVHVYRIALTATDGVGASTTTILNLEIRGPHQGVLIMGTAGNDDLVGQLGPDIIYGLGGNDTLQGREGPDTYAFDLGFGHDTILDHYQTGPGLETTTVGDIISFGAGITKSNVTVTNPDAWNNSQITYHFDDATLIEDFFAGDILLTVGSTGDTVRIEHQTVNSRFDDYRHSVELVRFADGSTWSAADLTNMVTTGGSGNDTLAGDSSDNVISGGAGNDRLIGREGNDTLWGGLGDDDLYGQEGDDTYIFNRGDGHDRIVDTNSYTSFNHGFDTLRFGAGIRPSDLIFTRNTENPDALSSVAGSLLIQIAGTNDSIRVYRQYSIRNDLSQGIDRFEFSDGTVLNRSQIDELVNPGNLIQGTDSAETLTGTSAGERIVGKKGNDMLLGSGGDDTYVWNLGDGNDTIQEYTITSFDVLELGAGIRPQDVTLSHVSGPSGDQLAGYHLYLTIAPTGEKITINWEFHGTSYSTIEEIRFVDGTVWTTESIIAGFLASTPGNDIIQGFPYRNDIMDGGAGNDELHGSFGADTYVFGRGYGVDMIYDKPDGIFQTVVDRIQFNSSVSSADVALSRVYRTDADGIQVIDTVFSISGTTDKLIIAGAQYQSEADQFTSITFGGDSAYWAGDSLAARYLAQVATTGNDNVIGFAKDEVISTGLGNDTIDGTYGNDTLIGGAGNDTYVLSREGIKIIHDAGTAADLDTLQLSNILAANVRIIRAGNENDLIITTANPNSDGKAILQGRLIGAEYSADQIRFADGTIWNYATILSHAQAAAADAHLVNGTTAANTIAGTSLAETFDGKAGDDAISGGAGEDIYIYRSGDGNDVITDTSTADEIDTLKLKDLTSGQVTLLKSGADLVIHVNATGQDITIKDQFTTDKFGIDEIVFSDRTVWDRAAIGNRASNHAPTDATIFGAAVYENEVNGASSGTVSGFDPDGTYAFTYALIDNAGGRFAINASTGQVTVANGALLNYEVATSHNITVRVTDPGELSIDKTFTINVYNANEAPTNATMVGGSIAENSTYGTLVGSVTGIDPDAGDAFTYSFTNDAGGRFTINASTGAITVASGALLDYETATSHSITVQVTDQAGLTFDKTLTITLTDVNESANHAPTNAILTGSSIAENASNGTTVGMVAGVDPDAEATLTYSLTDNAGGRFAINATTGVLTVANGTLLNFESAASHNVTVRVTDQSGLTFDKVFTLGVTNVNEAPSNATLTGGSVAENAANGTVVGTVAGVDPDTGATLTYSLTDNAGGRFAINATTGALTVANGALLDFETASSHNITVRVTDQGGLSFDKGLTIALTDVSESTNHAPTNATLTGGSVAENAANGVAVGTVAGVDPDAGATLTYSLTDNAGGRFAINATTGVLTVANGTLLNFESAASHNVSVRVTDQSGLTFDKVFTLGVTNVNEAPSNATLTGGSVAENAANGTMVGTVAGADPDAGAILTYSLTDNAGGRFAINASTGAITVADGSLLDYETATSHAITVRVVDQGGLAFDKTLTIALTEAEGESYPFTRGDGQIVIGGDYGSISFDSSIAASDILLQSDGSDLVILVRGTEDSIRIGGDLTINDWGTSSAIQQLKFSDGSTMDIGQPAPGVGSPITFTWVGTDTSVYNGSIYGNDVFEMVSGSGWGFDTGGQTTVLYGGGQSYIWANGGTGVIKFAPGISADDIILQSVGSNLIILIRDTDDQILVYEGLALNDWGASSAIQQFQFSDGSTIDIGQPAPGVGSPITFTWLEAGNGSAYGNNVFEIAPGASLTFNNANSGQNTVVFGGGQNDINANGATGVIQFGAGISASDIILQSQGSDLIILVRGTDDRIQIYGGGLTINDWGVSSAIQHLRFSDGSTMDIGQPAPGVGSPITFTWVGTDTSVYNGSIYGNDIFEIVSGSGWGFDAAGGQTTALFNGGQSYIWANGGTGVVKFGPSISASDVILQSEGSDLVILVRGTDDRLQIYGGLTANDWGTSSAIQQLQFSDGSTMDIGQPAPGVGSPITFTWVGTSTSVYNGSIYGNDVFEMVSGSGWGFDTGGQTTVLYSGGQSYIWANGGTGVIKFAPGISADDVILQSAGSDLMILIRGTEDRIQIYGGLALNEWGTSSAIQQFQFSDGSTIDIGQPAAGVGSPITFTWLEPGSGSIYGNNVFELPPGTNLTFNNENDGQNTVVFGGGQNNIDPNGATGIIQFGAGISAGDIILQSEGSDLIILVRGTEDSIRISGDLTVNEWGTSSAIQQLKFSDGSTMNIGQPAPGLGSPITFTWVGTSTSVYNGSIYGDDVFEMVSGSGWGFDTVGQTTVLYSGGQSYIWANGGTGVIKFAPGISADDIILQTAGSNLIILIRDTDDQILVYEGLTAHEGGTSSAIQQLQFSDGSTMDIGEFEPGVESLTVTENSADTDVAGVTLDGTAESETLTGTSEEDVFSGLGGNDTLRGLGGGDTYKFGVGSGNDLILEAGTDSGIDVVHLSALAVSDVTFGRSGSDLLIKINSSNEELMVEGQFDGHPRIEQVHFADGTVWEGSQITDAAAWIHGTTGNDTISGTVWNDTISGGAGNDTLSGGAGDDLFVFRTGFGQDSISDFSVGHDKLEFGDGLFSDAAAAFAAASAQGSDTIITIDASTTVLLQNVALANLHVDDFRVA